MTLLQGYQYNKNFIMESLTVEKYAWEKEHFVNVIVYRLDQLMCVLKYFQSKSKFKNTFSMKHGCLRD